MGVELHVVEPAEADPVGKGGVGPVEGIVVVHLGELGWPVAVVPGAAVLLRGDSSALSGAMGPLGASCVDRVYPSNRIGSIPLRQRCRSAMLILTTADWPSK